MNRNLLYLIAIICSTQLGGCGNKQQPVEASNPFQNITLYFEKEINKLQVSKSTLVKTIYEKNESEQVTVTDPDWKSELVPFTESLISKPAILRSFKTDSLNSGLSKIVFITSRDSSSTVKSVSEYSTNGIVDSIVIIKGVENLYYESSEILTYFGNGNYRIVAENNPQLGKEIAFILEGKSTIP